MSPAQFYKTLGHFKGKFVVRENHWIRDKNGNCPINSVYMTSLNNDCLSLDYEFKIVDAADKRGDYSQKIRKHLMGVLELCES